jgi:hypothetical protein
LARPGEQASDLTLGIVGQVLQPVVGNVCVNNAAGLSFAGFDVRAQQSCEKRGLFDRGRKQGPSG